MYLSLSEHQEISRATELKNKLKHLEELKEQPGEWGTQKEQVELRIEILRIPCQTVLPRDR